MDKQCDTKYYCMQTVLPSINFNFPSPSASHNNNNGTNSTSSCREVKGFQFIKDTDEQQMGHQYDNAQDMSNASEKSQEASIDEDVDTGSSNEEGTSAGNSTDNLSCLTDNDTAGDDEDVAAIFMRNNTVSDEEISINSDDCVYAYRGADYDIVAEQQRNNPVEDETDFLEMDFDPDPEIDNANESQNSSFTLSYDREANIKELSFTLPHNTKDVASLVAAASTSTTATGVSGAVAQKTSTLRRQPDCVQIQRNHGPVETNDGKIRTNFFLKNDLNAENLCINDGSSKITGAVPKKLPTLEKKSQKHAKKTDYHHSGNPKMEPPSFSHFNCCDEMCLDCLEQEFLVKTVGKQIESFKCKKCKPITNGGSGGFGKIEKELIGSTSVQSIFEDNSTTNLFNDIRQLHQRLGDLDLCNGKSLQERRNKEISIPSIDIDEHVLVDALEKLEVTFSRETISNYFSAEVTIPKDVPDLILKLSKKNCNYKKITELIKTASNEELFIKFIPNQHFDTIPETVQVDIYEILQLWTPHSNLHKLMHFGKRFLTMNVLGQVINAIRQAQLKIVKSSTEFISIPQYYKSGYICIAKKIT